MTILFVGNEDIDFTNRVTVMSNSSTGVETAYTRAAVYSGQGADNGGLVPNADLPPLTEAWLHTYAAPRTDNTPLYNFMGMGSQIKPRKIGIRNSLNGDAQLFADNGTGTTLTGTVFKFPQVRGHFDLHVKITGTSALVEAYQDGVLCKTDTFTLVTPYTLDTFELSAGSSVTTWGYLFSQVVYATVPTIGWKVFTRQPTGSGAHTAFNGDYTAVDEESVNLDDHVSAGVAAKETFTRAALTVPSGMEVKALALSSYARTGLPDLDDLYLLLRKGGTDYRSVLKTLTPGYQRHDSIWETDPATSLKFANSDVESATAIEFGVEVA